MEGDHDAFPGLLGIEFGSLGVGFRHRLLVLKEDTGHHVDQFLIHILVHHQHRLHSQSVHIILLALIAAGRDGVIQIEGILCLQGICRLPFDGQDLDPVRDGQLHKGSHRRSAHTEHRIHRSIFQDVCRFLRSFVNEFRVFFIHAVSLKDRPAADGCQGALFSHQDLLSDQVCRRCPGKAAHGDELQTHFIAGSHGLEILQLLFIEIIEPIDRIVQQIPLGQGDIRRLAVHLPQSFHQIAVGLGEELHVFHHVAHFRIHSGGVIAVRGPLFSAGDDDLRGRLLFPGGIGPAAERTAGHSTHAPYHHQCQQYQINFFHFFSLRFLFCFNPMVEYHYTKYQKFIQINILCGYN